MTSPTILISVDLRQLDDAADIAHVVRDTYVQAVETAGGCPLLLPVLSNPSALGRYLDFADGLLLVGGTDYRTENEHSECTYVTARREQHDFTLFRAAAERQIAILGVCLGMQLINLGTGGTIYEDIASQLPNAWSHAIEGHDVLLETDSRLGRLLGEQITVNSSHHQAVRAVGHQLRVAGRAPDGVVEAIESASDRFLVGVQWHPERMLSDERQGHFLSTFIAAAAEGGFWPPTKPSREEESKRE